MLKNISVPVLVASLLAGSAAIAAGSAVAHDTKSSVNARRRRQYTSRSRRVIPRCQPPRRPRRRPRARRAPRQRRRSRSSRLRQVRAAAPRHLKHLSEIGPARQRRLQPAPSRRSRPEDRRDRLVGMPAPSSRQCSSDRLGRGWITENRPRAPRVQSQALAGTVAGHRASRCSKSSRSAQFPRMHR